MNIRMAARSMHPIKLFDAGSGWRKGHAVEFARKLLKKKQSGIVIAVEPMQGPNYKVPRNMAFEQGHPVASLKLLRPNSVEIITDYFNLGYVIKANEKSVTKGAKKLSAKASAKLQLTKLLDYLKSVKRALVPGGQFIILGSVLEALVLGPVIHAAGFKVDVRQVSKKGVESSGSPQAIAEMKLGSPIYRIIAEKP